MLLTTRKYTYSVNWIAIIEICLIHCCLSSTQKMVDVQFSEAECLKIDAANRKVYCRSNISNNLNEKEEFVVDYDYLIIGVGANVNTFNTPGVTENCHFLKVTLFITSLLWIILSCVLV